MDDATRGFVEKILDNYVETVVFTKGIEWVREEIPISSLRDLVLGYAIGCGQSTIVTLINIKTGDKASDEDLKQIDQMFKRRLPDIIERINRELNV